MDSFQQTGFQAAFHAAGVKDSTYYFSQGDFYGSYSTHAHGAYPPATAPVCDTVRGIAHHLVPVQHR
jgi:hypothetical protein